MLGFIIRRILYAIPTLIMVSMVSYAIIELPPGDYLTSYISQLEQQGSRVSQSELAALNQRYGLDQPVHVRYWKWISRFVQGDMGMSFDWNRPVKDLVFERVGLTALISLMSTLFIWAVAMPIGIYSATRQYSPRRLFLYLHRLHRRRHPRLFAGVGDLVVGVEHLWR